ncbi:MAG: hypothetical protein SGPRY_009342, partial [Prymnesium sp.]
MAFWKDEVFTFAVADDPPLHRVPHVAAGVAIILVHMLGKLIEPRIELSVHHRFDSLGGPVVPTQSDPDPPPALAASEGPSSGAQGGMSVEQIAQDVADITREREPFVTVLEGHLLFHSAVIREVQIKETHRRLTKLHGTSFNSVFKLAGQAAADQVAMVQSSRLPHLVWSLFVGERGERERLLRRLYPHVALGSRMIRRGLGRLHWPQMVSRVCLFATEMSLEYQELVKEASTHINVALKTLRSAIRQFYKTPVPSDSSETEPWSLISAKWMALLNRLVDVCLRLAGWPGLDDTHQSTASEVTDLPKEGSPFTRFMASAFPERPPASQPLQNPHDSQRLGQDQSLPSSSSEPPSHQPMPPAPPGTAVEGAEPISEAWLSCRKAADQRYTLRDDPNEGGKGSANLRHSNCLRLEADSRRKSTPVAYQLGSLLRKVASCHLDTTGQWDRPVMMLVSRKGEDCGQAGFKYTLFLECKAKGVELASFLATWFYDFGHQNTSRDGSVMLPICDEGLSEVAW